jgi:hypothetical protein
MIERLLLRLAYPMYACENCIGMHEHGCYCELMGASGPGRPATRVNVLARRLLGLMARAGLARYPHAGGR